MIGLCREFMKSHDMSKLYEAVINILLEKTYHSFHII